MNALLHRGSLPAVIALVLTFCTQMDAGAESRTDGYLLLDSRVVLKTQNARLSVGKIQKHLRQSANGGG